MLAVLFAKPPVAGKSKTRLAPLVGEERAAELAACFLADTWAMLARLPLDVVISTTNTDPLAFDLAPPPELWDQGDGDLGARMERGFQRGLERAPAVLAIGADAPDLSTDRVQVAMDALLDHDACILPASDGGFLVLGLKACPDGLLADLPWSQANTCERTVARLRERGMRVAVLDGWFDVDEPPDLRALAERLQASPQSAPRTARSLAESPLPALRTTPRISVIVPVLNEAERLGAQLDDLCRRPGIDEILVVDGGSIDRSRAIAKAHSVSVLTAPKGRASQMNAGAAAATGDVLWFVHADVRLPDQAAARVAEALADPQVVAGAFVTWTVNDLGFRPWALLLHLADLRSRVTRIPYGDQAVFVRRSVFQSIGGFPDLALMEDVALAHELRKIGRIARIWDQVTVSGRRFMRRPIRTMLAWNTLPWLYRGGVPTPWLARIYG